MISEAYLWIWLPGASKPVVCGKLQRDNDVYSFVYGRSYLKRENAIALEPRDLPLEEGVFTPVFGETHSVIRDAAPDAWGRRVLMYRSGGQNLTELDYLLRAGSDRIGALDVRLEPTDYHVSQADQQATLEDLLLASERLETGQAIPQSLGNALLHGSSVGGARPKALLNDGHCKWIAKFSSSTDYYPVVKSEYATMCLASQCSIEVPAIKLVKILGKDVLLVKRFDRENFNDKWPRRFLISGLTALQLHESEADMASYPELASFIRRFGAHYPADAQQLYRRMIFNILVGNTDDHARNHAFFWDGHQYRLTPAYDICPMLRTGQTASQGMIVGDKGRESTLRNALSLSEQFGVSRSEAKSIQEELAETVRTNWDKAADCAGLTDIESKMLRQSTVLSPACFY